METQEEMSHYFWSALTNCLPVGYGSNSLWIDQSGSFFNPVWPEPLNDGSWYEIGKNLAKIVGTSLTTRFQQLITQEELAKSR
jgi:hypothetical protein